MEDDEEEPPLAVQIAEEKIVAASPPNGDVSVGVTVITGYLGSGKSTVTIN
jgi:Mrp family chromosome partitioning ATPase